MASPEARNAGMEWTEDRGNEPIEDSENEYVPVVPFSLNPSHVLMTASLPLCIGAYVGYQRQVNAVKKEMAEQAARAAMDAAAPKIPVITLDGRMLAARALGLGTLLSMGGFGLISAVTFYASGCRSWGEAVSSMRKWGPQKRREVEAWVGVSLGIDDHPDMKATRHMTEDEEMEYIQKTYFPPEVMEKPSNQG